MPIDYSKFDRIDDSDEDVAPSKHGSSSSSAATKTAMREGTAFAPPTRQPARGGGATKTTKEGSRRNTLEPTGLDERLRVIGPGAADLEGLEAELDRWVGPRSGSARSGSALAAPELEAPKPGEPKRLCMKSDGRKKIHTTYHDGAETVEEFDERTDVLLLRKTRRPTKLGGEGDWVYEVGQPPEQAFDPHSDLMRASASNPIFLRKDTPEHLQWRIRNLPYTADVYSVTVDHDKQEIVVRTSNKKYYKRIAVPDLASLGLVLKDELLSWKHQHNTLIISYVKPAEVVAQEQKVLKEAEHSALKM
mmetsp:Transcript_79795/g.247924  ORF Transcript_79795/g.247924 Transcript_79795/m.247924 type:complete len:305 (-) Transcript_79795:67-981(-)